MIPLFIILILVLPTSGTIEHHNYGHNEDLEWVVESSCFAIEANTSLMDLEDGSDFLRITDWMGTSSFTGSASVSYIVASDTFTVKFESDDPISEALEALH